MAPTLSAVVMVFNERRTIDTCLRPLLELCDEVVVVDDCSTDGTWEYLESLGGRVRAVQHRHTTFAAQREYGKAQATGAWILSMDGDEYVTPELARAIRAALARPDAPDGFFLRRRNPYPRTLRGHFWTAHPRLVRADRCRWVVTDNPHSPLETGGLRFETLQGGHLEHEPLPDVATLLRKNINRSLIIAAQQREAGRRPGAAAMAATVLARFLKFYLGSGAFRFGASGMVMAWAMAQEALAKSAFLVETPTTAPESLQDGGPGSYPAGTQFVTPTKGEALPASGEALRGEASRRGAGRAR